MKSRPAGKLDSARRGLDELLSASQEREADIADLYAFLDPNDNTRLILAVTHQGFIVPGEAVNFGYYDPTIRFQIEVETNGDARSDDEIVVAFGTTSSFGPALE